MLSRVSKIQGKRSREKEAYGETWSSISRSVREDNNWNCSICKQNFSTSRNSLHSHHIIPLSKGGSNSRGNLQTLCISCHKREHSHH